MSTSYSPAKVDRIGQIIEALTAEGEKTKPNWRRAVRKLVKDLEGITAEELYVGQLSVMAQHGYQTSVDMFEVAREEIAKAKEA